MALPAPVLVFADAALNSTRAYSASETDLAGEILTPCLTRGGRSRLAGRGIPDFGVTVRLRPDEWMSARAPATASSSVSNVCAVRPLTRNS